MFDNKFFGIEKCERKSANKILLWTSGIIAAGILLTIYSPLEYLFHYLGYTNTNGCPLLTLSGVPCPLCGMGRSFWAILSLDFGKAFYYNPSGIFFFLLSGIILAGIFLLSFLDYKIKLKDASLKLWYLFAGIVILIWILNILFGHHF